jgi:hypothetical protein
MVNECEQRRVCQELYRMVFPPMYEPEPFSWRVWSYWQYGLMVNQSSPVSLINLTGM